MTTKFLLGAKPRIMAHKHFDGGEQTAKVKLSVAIDAIGLLQKANPNIPGVNVTATSKKGDMSYLCLKRLVTLAEFLRSWKFEGSPSVARKQG